MQRNIGGYMKHLEPSATESQNSLVETTSTRAHRLGYLPHRGHTLAVATVVALVVFFVATILG